MALAIAIWAKARNIDHSVLARLLRTGNDAAMIVIAIRQLTEKQSVEGCDCHAPFCDCFDHLLIRIWIAFTTGFSETKT